MKKRWMVLFFVILASSVVAFNVYESARKNIILNKQLYINQNGQEPLLLTEDEFNEKVEAKGLEDAKSAISSISDGQTVTLCQSTFCDQFLEAYTYEYFPNKFLEKTLMEQYLVSVFDATPEQLIDFERYIQEERSNEYFLPSVRNGLGPEIGDLRIVENNQSYYFMFVANQSNPTALYNLKSDTLNQVMSVIGKAFPRDAEIQEKLEMFEDRHSEIVDVFKVWFIYEIPKDTFIEKNKIKAFFHKFNSIPNRERVEEISPTITTVDILLSSEQHLGRLSPMFSQIFITNFYYQIFEKRFEIDALVPEELEDGGEEQVEGEETEA